MKSMIANAELAPQGEEKIEWVRRHMPVLDGIAAEFERDQPFRGLKAVVCVFQKNQTENRHRIFRCCQFTVCS